MAGAERIIAVGGPRTGKSTLAREYRWKGIPVYCGDPISMVKEYEPGVTYLPEFEHLPEKERWSAGSEHVARAWFSLPGPWVMEGQIMARALRKWMRHEQESSPALGLPLPCDRIIVLTQQHMHAVTKPGQIRMHAQVMDVWREIAWRFENIAEVR